MGQASRILVNVALVAAALALLLVVGLIVAVNVSPRPFAWYVNRQFANGVGVTQVTPAIYTDLSQNVRVQKDIDYPSRHKDNRLDFFSPKDATDPVPTILWIHGGGYVGGDKAGLETWATMIAAKGYTVISIDYELAPRVHYPSPLIQLGEAYEFVKANPQRFPTVDLHRLILGGDSAGAQLASQFIAMQTNAELAKSMQSPAIIREKDIIAVILYCGPYDFPSLYDSESWFGRFLVRQVGWAYFGIRDWRDTPQAMQASTVEHVTRNFPPTFITDGNTGSFEADAQKLEARLKENGVYVDSLFYPVEHGKLNHEYQLDFSIRKSIECYNRTLVFLVKVTLSNPVARNVGVRTTNVMGD
jgi:acetyl esterase/lipase